MSKDKYNLSKFYIGKILIDNSVKFKDMKRSYLFYTNNFDEDEELTCIYNGQTTKCIRFENNVRLNSYSYRNGEVVVALNYPLYYLLSQDLKEKNQQLTFAQAEQLFNTYHQEPKNKTRTR